MVSYEFWLASVFSFFPLALGLLLGITALTIAWGGRRIGILVGALGLVSSLVGLGGFLFAAPHLWWIAVIPIWAGGAAVRAWHRHTGPATARRPRFALRGLLTSFLFMGLILGGIASQYRQTRIEEEAAAKLETLFGRGNMQVAWIFGRVTHVISFKLRDPADFDRAADTMDKFSQLLVLQINDPLTGQTTERLGRLSTLRSLLAQHIQVTDDDLRPLANLHNLEYLDLDACQITDSGLAHLAGLKRLRVLHLYNANQITPAAMANLRAGLPRLDNP